MNTPRIVVDGEQFSLWTRGIYLQRKGARGIIVNEFDCEQAAEALSQGETVYLSDHRKICGTLRLVDDEYIQEVLSP